MSTLLPRATTATTRSPTRWMPWRLSICPSIFVNGAGKDPGGDGHRMRRGRRWVSSQCDYILGRATDLGRWIWRVSVRTPFCHDSQRWEKVRLLSLSSIFYFCPWVRRAWVQVFDFRRESGKFEFVFKKNILSQESLSLDLKKKSWVRKVWVWMAKYWIKLGELELRKV